MFATMLLLAQLESSNFGCAKGDFKAPEYIYQAPCLFNKVFFSFSAPLIAEKLESTLISNQKGCDKVLDIFVQSLGLPKISDGKFIFYGEGGYILEFAGGKSCTIKTILPWPGRSFVES